MAYATQEDLARLLSHHLSRDVLLDQINALIIGDEIDDVILGMEELQVMHSEAGLLGGYFSEPLRMHSLYIHLLRRIRRIVFRARGEDRTKLIGMLKKLKRWRELFCANFPAADFPRVVVPGEEEEDLVEAAGRLRLREERVSPGTSSSHHEQARNPRNGGSVPGGGEESSSDTESAPSTRNSSATRGARSRSGRTGQDARNRREPSSPEDEDSDLASSTEMRGSRRSNPRPRGRTNPVADWKVRYGGSEDLLAFLEEIEELRDTHFVEESEILAGIGALLTGSAKIWHKSMKNKIYTWDAFKLTIRRAFLPNCDDDAILDRLKKMRQRQEETYLVYEARMVEQFSRLDSPLPDAQRLKYLLGGLHLFYRNRICSADVRTCRELRQACTRLEPDKAQLRKLEGEKERTDKTTDKRYEREKERADKTDKRYEREKEERSRDKSERGRRNRDTYAVEAPVKKGAQGWCEDENPEDEDAPEVDAVVTSAGRPPVQQRGYPAERWCWRCGENGHLSLGCKTDIFCISCGQRGVIAERCPQCALPQYRGHWMPSPVVCHPSYQQQNQPNFPNGTWSWGTQVPPPSSAPPLEMFQPPPNLPPPIRPQQPGHQWDRGQPQGAMGPRGNPPGAGRGRGRTNQPPPST